MCRKADENIKNKLNSEISQTNTSSKKWWKLLKQNLSSSTPGADGPSIQLLTEPPNAFSSLRLVGGSTRSYL